MSSHAFQIILALVLTVLLFHSVALVSLTHLHGRFVEDNDYTGTYIGAAYPGANLTFYGHSNIGNLPLHLDRAVPRFVLVVASLAIVSTLATVIALSCSWNNATRVSYLILHHRASADHNQRARVFYLQYISLAISALAFAAFVARFVVHSTSTPFNPLYASDLPNFPGFVDYGLGGQYDVGKFDLERWTCDVSKVFDVARPDVAPEYHRQCAIETAARWALLPWWLFSLAATALAWVVFRQSKPITHDTENGFSKVNDAAEK